MREKKTVDSVEHQDIVQPQVLYTLYSCVFPISKLSSTTGYFKATYQFTLASKQHPLRRKFFIYVALTGVFIFICWSALLQSFKRYEKVSYLPKTHYKQFILPASFQNGNHPQIPTNKKKTSSNIKASKTNNNFHPSKKPRTPKPNTSAFFSGKKTKQSHPTTFFIPSSIHPQPDLKRPNFHSKASIPLDAKVVQLGYSMEVLLESASWPPKKVEVAMETWQAAICGVSLRPRIMDLSYILVGVSETHL